MRRLCGRRDGPGRKPRRDGCSHASHDRDLFSVSCSSSVCLPGRPHLWLFCISAAFGFRSGARRGSGNCWFRCSHRSGSLSEAPAGDGALTRGWRNGGRLLRGGDCELDKFTCECPSSSLPIMKRRRLSAFLADLPSDLTTEVIVVDSNSNDGTPEIAARMGARVVQEPRRGYGRACLTGLAAANSPDVVVFLDGDYSDRPSELPILLAPIVEGRADITLGSRLARAELCWGIALASGVRESSRREPDQASLWTEYQRSRPVSRWLAPMYCARSRSKRPPMAGRLR